jgi:hypothetical protein
VGLSPRELRVLERRGGDFGGRRALDIGDFDRAERIGEFYGYPESRAIAELLIDCEEDRALRAVLVRMLREADR